MDPETDPGSSGNFKIRSKASFMDAKQGYR